MYYFLKDNVFYLKTENNGIFLKNTICTVNIKSANSYKLFQVLLPLLNGNTNVESVIEKIKNKKAKEFFKNFIDMLVSNKFVLFSKFPIDLEKYNDFTKSLLCCYGSNNLPEENINNIVQYELCSANEKINGVLEKIISDDNNIVRASLNDKDYIMLKLFKNDESKNIYIYSPKNKKEVIISSVCPDNRKINKVLYELPLHVFEILASLIKVELSLDGYGVDVIDFSKENYIFDLRLLTGHSEQREAANES